MLITIADYFLILDSIPFWIPFPHFRFHKPNKVKNQTSAMITIRDIYNVTVILIMEIKDRKNIILKIKIRLPKKVMLKVKIRSRY